MTEPAAKRRSKHPRPRRVDPGKARYLSDLPGPDQVRRRRDGTSPLSMREALVRCYALDVPVEQSVVTKGIQTATLRAMERHGLVHVVHGLVDGKGRGKPPLWKPTARGVEIVTADEPRSLGVRVESVEVESTTDTRELRGPRRPVLVDEPEPIDDVTQARLTERANATDAARRAGVTAETLAARRSAEDRLRALRALANERGVDVRSEVRMVERMLDAMERKIRQQVSARAA